ncbi:hypothetical protein DI392_08275 [Vibrio albus]|uniref:WD40 repeat protein n=1 Tax=Vibrio albus TaxID=2200953 RepID=A0A2U3BBL6_9VIBR|nr:hypothetical protein [Vibrio albus]PWI34173.1 hypothetical protein DI392_08275 [Vibrio albus]
MKWLLLILTSVFAITVKADINLKGDLTQFDYPFLLGDWYLFNPNPQQSQEDFLTIKLSLASDYKFSIRVEKKDYSVDYWQGHYSVGVGTLILGVNADIPQSYQYRSSHNRLMLNGITFIKGLPNAIAGSWTSRDIQGEDILASNVSQMDLVLQPDFVFLFMAQSQDGTFVTHEGIYFMEDDHLILMYEEGEQDSRYTLSKDTLTLTSEHFDMYAELARVE